MANIKYELTPESIKNLYDFAITMADNPFALEGFTDEKAKLTEALRISGIDKHIKIKKYSDDRFLLEQKIDPSRYLLEWIIKNGSNSNPNSVTQIVQAIQNFHEDYKQLDRNDPACTRKPVLNDLIQKVNSHDSSRRPHQNIDMPVTLNCPQRVLEAFRELLRGTPLLGAAFTNPYSKEVIFLPQNPEDLTARHLQILARNENMNTTGKMNTKLYRGLLTDDQIARLRCLVKATNVTGVTFPKFTGGYPILRSRREIGPEKTIVVDQAGLQWQEDLRNTGGMFFYPNNQNDPQLPPNYQDWQNDMYQAMYGNPRPALSRDALNVTWKGVAGRLDLVQVQLGIESEFTQALDAVVHQAQLDNEIIDKVVNFKFLIAGEGGFRSGLGLKDDDVIHLEQARLLGIQKALESLASLPEDNRKAKLGKIGRIELPFSGVDNDQYNPTLKAIEEQVKALGLKWGGVHNEDAYSPREGFINATTNCGDPHAMIGNEGKYESVDAAMASNAYLQHLNVANNPNAILRLSDGQNLKNAPKSIEDIVGRVITELRERGSVKKSTKLIDAFLKLTPDEKQSLRNITPEQLNKINKGDTVNCAPNVLEFMKTLKINRNIFSFGTTKSFKSFINEISKLQNENISTDLHSRKLR